jgi:uncharacterized protein (TIGR00730 family)
VKQQLSICVFCGSASGLGKQYINQARAVGNLIAKHNFQLIYGGASVGVMGALADQVLEAEGQAIGVIPQSLVEWEVAHPRLTKLEVVETMHQRKQRMYDLSDIFVAMPGGMGTLDELCEIITWAQLKYHTKPMYILNEGGYFNHLLEHFRQCQREGFLSLEHLNLAQEIESLEQFGQILSNFKRVDC